MGNNDNSPMNPALASGVTGAAPIWNRIMIAALSGKKDEPFVRPGNIVEMDIDAYGGGLPTTGQSTRKERFIKGTEPTGPAAIYQNLKISRHDGTKLANSVEITKGEYDTKQYIVFVEQDPVSTDGKNRWQQSIDAWTAAQGDAKFHPPKDTYQGSDTVAVSIKQPGDMQQVGNDVSVRVEASSVNTITKVQLFDVYNGTQKQLDERSDTSYLITVHLDGDGSHILKAVAFDNKGNSSEQSIHLGVNKPYATPTPSPSPTSIPSPSPTPVPSVTSSP